MLEIYEKSGKLPHALETRPILKDEWKVPMGVFEELSGSRQTKFQGVGEIPYSEVVLFGLTHGYTGADLVELWEEVHLIDQIFVEALTKMQKSSKPGK